MLLATGGPLGSTQKKLVDDHRRARSDCATGKPIPPEQTSIGSFGNLDTNGNLFVMLPDNDPADFTPNGPYKYYTFYMGGRNCGLIIQNRFSPSPPTKQDLLSA